MSYLCYLCLLTYSGVEDVLLSYVLLRLVYTMFPVFLNYPLLIAPSVFSKSNVYLRWYLTLQGDNSLKSIERFDHIMFVCRFQASR